MAIDTLLPMMSRGPVISETDVLRFEQRLGQRLPADYREFLLTINGGKPSLEKRVFTIGRDSTILNSFYGIGHPISDIDKGQYSNDEFPRELLVIGYDGTGSSICLVIDGKKRGEVWFYDRIDPHDPKLWLPWYERKHDFVRVAGSFTEFIQMLRPYDDED